MVTRARVGTFKPNPRYAATATTSTLSPIPRTVHQALKDPNWTKAMQLEFDALIANHTWELVPRPPRAHVISGKWIFRHKFKEDGSFDRYKARWVVRGFTQRAGVDYGEAYCPVVKPATVRTVLHLAAQRGWPVHQLDVNNAFLHGVLDEQVYARQPAGFNTNPDLVCRLSKSLYGLKQAPRAWYMRLASFLGSMGFRPTRSDSSLFVLRQGKESVYLLLYVDDIVLTASSKDILHHVIRTIHNEFALKDMGPLHFFLSIQVTRRPDGFHLHQQQYALDLLDRAGMADCRPSDTPVDTSGKVSGNDGTALSTADASDYRSIVGALQYLTMTRPDLQYAV
jgi:histone deacetylase 1/2